MFNIIKDEFEESPEDILETINKMLEENEKNKEKENGKESKE